MLHQLFCVLLALQLVQPLPTQGFTLSPSLRPPIGFKDRGVTSRTGGLLRCGDSPRSTLRMAGGSDIPPPPPPPEKEGALTQQQVADAAAAVTKVATAAPASVLDDDDDDDDKEGLVPMYKVVLLVASFAILSAAAALVFSKGTTLAEAKNMVRNIPKVAQAIPITLALYVLVDWLAAGMMGWAKKAGLDMTMASFLRGLVKYGATAIALISILGTLGVQTSGLTAAVTSLGLSIGLASQKVLSNLAAGLMLLVLRPFKSGDFVVLAGKATGVVKDISLFSTSIDTVGNCRISVPNSEVYGSIVENFSKHRMRMIEIDIITAPSGGVEHARKVIETAVNKYARLQDEEMMLRRLYKRKANAAKLQQGTKDAPGPTMAPVTNTTKGNMFDLGHLLDKKAPPIDLSDLGLDPQGKAPPKVWMKAMTPGGYNWCARVWVPTSQFESVKFSMTEDIAAALKKAKIRTQADVHEMRYLPKEELRAMGLET